MAKIYSKESNFESNYGGGFISDAQYITECLCVLRAKKDKLPLGHKFWQQPYWSKFYRVQIPAANKLLNQYPAVVIINALRDRRCWKIESLRAKWLLEPLLKEKMLEYEAQKKTTLKTTMDKTSTVQKPRQKSGKQSILNKLRELDNDKTGI